MRMTFSDDHGQPEGVPFPEEARKLTERGPDGTQSMSEWLRSFHERFLRNTSSWGWHSQAAVDVITQIERDGPYLEGELLALEGETTGDAAFRLAECIKLIDRSGSRDFWGALRRSKERGRAQRSPGTRTSPVAAARPTGSCSLADAANRTLWGIGLFLLGAFCGLALHGCAA